MFWAVRIFWAVAVVLIHSFPQAEEGEDREVWIFRAVPVVLIHSFSQVEEGEDWEVLGGATVPEPVLLPGNSTAPSPASTLTAIGT